jgi:hypothetical protein
MNKTVAAAASMAAASALALALAPVAAAQPGDGDLMYRVGTDIQPGDYTYTVVGNGVGSWETCADANCNNSIDFEGVDGLGHTGYFTVPAGAKFVKTNDLFLSPA